MRIYNEATNQIKQGGMRRGANMGILRVDHPDVMEFIHCKDDGTGITNFNISLAITDDFMKALETGSDYTLYSPRDDKFGKNGKVSGTQNAQAIWNEIAKSAWKTGDPGMVFIDRINAGPANPIRAEGWEVESTNPCGEQPLYPFDACNLGSIFLGYFVKNIDGKRQIDWDNLVKTVHSSVRLLDSVIEMNPFPLPQILETVRNVRRIGLGVGGWADMLVELGIAYDSSEALELAEKVMKVINEEGHKASQQLARERGTFKLFKQSIYKDDLPIRNGTVTTIAPTGSIGILANASGGIEPLFAIAYQHIVKNENRTLTFVNPKFEEVARARGFYSQELMNKVAAHGTIRDIEEIPADVRAVFGTAHEIHPDWHIKMQAAFQKYTDNAVSKTINLPNSATVEDVKHAYELAWKTGCKGITVFRDGCKNEQVLNLGTNNDKKKEEAVAVAEAPVIRERPVKMEGATYKIGTPLGTAFITINHDTNGNPFEIFVTIGKAGSEVAAMAEALGRLISKFFKIPGPTTVYEKVEMIVDQLRGIGGGSSVGFGPNKIRSLPEAVAKALAMHSGLIGSAVEPKTLEPTLEITGNEHTKQLSITESVVKKGDLCPGCGNASLIFEEGCKKCYGCGYSEC